MRMFDYREKWKKLLTPEIVSYLTQIHEFKGEQKWFLETKEDVLTQLADRAKTQSAGASSKLAGVDTSDSRLKALVRDTTRPRTHNEREIAGYRDVLNTIHENYDYIVAGGKAWNPYYCQSFHTTEEKLVNIGLPRIDHLLETEDENRQAVFSDYPQMKEKQVILYAPTFRRNIELKWEELLEKIDFNQYILVIKGHPNQRIEAEGDGILLCPEFKAVDLLAVCDYLITDYSAIAVEAAILNKKTYYYLYDYEEYTEKNGINVNPFESMPGCAFRSAGELMESLASGNYPKESLEAYRQKYLPEDLGHSTEKLRDLVLSHLQ